MDPKIEIKQEDLLPDDVASQNETEFFHKIVTMNRNSDGVFLDDDCNMAIKTEIKSETPFPKYFVKQIKCETVTCSNNWETDRKTESCEQTLVSDFGSQNEDEFLPEDTVMKVKKDKHEHRMDSKIEIKVEPWWLETETSSVCDGIKDGDFPLVKSRLCTEAVSGTSSGKSPLPSAEFSGRNTSFIIGKDLECEHQKSDSIEIPATEERVPLELSDKYIDGGEMYIRPLYLNKKSLIHNDQRSHKCNICAKSFHWLSHLRAHNLIHEGKRTHQCKACDKSFTRKSHLKTHNLIHEGKKPHRCKICDKSFTQLATLKTHNLIHDGKKPHKCKTCDKSFTRESHLKTHNLIHEGNKPHQCNICDTSFTHLSALKRHYLIHEGKKPHQCKTCDKSFTLLSNLKAHNLIHESKKPHQCKSCDKSFTRVSHLQTHNLIHEGKKPHQCKICDKSFTYSSTLKRHYLIHEAKKPQQCKTRDKSFIELSTLKKHNLINEDRK